jgi:hypothetical protein
MNTRADARRDSRLAAVAADAKEAKRFTAVF